MRQQGSGTIINTSSIGGKIYTPLGAWYHATKHALEGWSDCLRLELKPLGINVVIIEPGLIETNFNSTAMKSTDHLDSAGAYQDLIGGMKKVGQLQGAGSPPAVVADVVAKVVATDQPKTRYHVGRLAGILLFVRRYVSDRFFDRFIMSQLKKVVK